MFSKIFDRYNLENKLLQFSAILFCIGIFTCTWDRVMQFEAFNFSFKLQQALFGTSLICTLMGLRTKVISKIWQERKNIFFISSFLIFIYYFCTSSISFYPLKSLFYSVWFLFNLCTIWINGILLAGYLSKNKIVFTVGAALVFHSVILIVDHLAYSYGYTGGLIGHNQDILLKWGASRPSAFSSEPSYLSVYFALGLLFLLPQTKMSMWKFWVPVYFLSIISLFIMASRTGVLGLMIGCLILFSFIFRKVNFRQLVLGVSSAIVLSVLTYFVLTPSEQRQKLSNNLVETIFEGKDGSGNSRLRAHAKAWQIAKDTHFLGIGLGASYKYWVTNYEKQSAPPFSEEHRGYELIMSIWGQLLAEGGAVTLLLYFIAGISMVLRTLTNWKATNNTFYLGSLVSVIVFFSFICFWIGNIARGDVWVWFAIWSVVPFRSDPAAHLSSNN